MTLRRWEPWSEALALREQMRNLLEAQQGGGDVFPIDLYEEDDAVHVEAQLPGVKPEDVDITIQGNALSIHAERHERHERREGRYYRRESSFGSFYRSVALPTTVDPQGAEARFEDGVLKVALPKSEEARPRRITVSSTTEPSNG
jgi:HSP20 family protein